MNNGFPPFILYTIIDNNILFLEALLVVTTYVCKKNDSVCNWGLQKNILAFHEMHLHRKDEVFE